MARQSANGGLASEKTLRDEFVSGVMCAVLVRDSNLDWAARDVAAHLAAHVRSAYAAFDAMLAARGEASSGTVWRCKNCGLEHTSAQAAARAPEDPPPCSKGHLDHDMWLVAREAKMPQLTPDSPLVALRVEVVKTREAAEQHHEAAVKACFCKATKAHWLGRMSGLVSVLALIDARLAGEVL